MLLKTVCIHYINFPQYENYATLIIIYNFFFNVFMNHQNWEIDEFIKAVIKSIIGMKLQEWFQKLML